MHICNSAFLRLTFVFEPQGYQHIVALLRLPLSSPWLHRTSGIHQYRPDW